MKQNEVKGPKFSRKKAKNHKLRKINIDQSEIKVGWDELLYDLIFVIIISKITEVIISVPVSELSFRFICSEIIMFISMLILWFNKVNMVNEFHIVQKKLNLEFKYLKYITYIEVLTIIIILHQIEGTINSHFFVTLILIVIIFSIMSMYLVRKYLYYQYSENEEELVNAIITFRMTKFTDVNYLHILERTGVLIILFIGEILSNLFTIVSSVAVLILTIYLVLKLFNKFVYIIETTGEKLNRKELVNPKIFLTFLPIFLMLLILIITLEYMDYYELSLNNLVVIEFMLLYLYTTIRAKRLTNKHLGIINLTCYLIYGVVLMLMLHFHFKEDLELLIVMVVILLDYNYAKIKMKAKIKQKQLIGETND